MRLVFIIVKKGSHKMPLKNSILRKKASAYLVMLEGWLGLVFFFKLLIFCALTRIIFFSRDLTKKKIGAKKIQVLAADFRRLST